MKENLNGTLILCLVIKTSWHKGSTVLGHGGSSFNLQGSTKCSDWLSRSRKTNTLGGLTLTTCQSSLAQPALRRLPWCKHLYLIIHLLLWGTNTAWRKAFPATDDWKGSSKMGRSHIANMKSNNFGSALYEKWMDIPSFGGLLVKFLPRHYQDSNMWMSFILSCGIFLLSDK